MRKRKLAPEKPQLYCTYKGRNIYKKGTSYQCAIHGQKVWAYKLNTLKERIRNTW